MIVKENQIKIAYFWSRMFFNLTNGDKIYTINISGIKDELADAESSMREWFAADKSIFGSIP